MKTREIKFRAWTENHWINKGMVYDWQDTTYIESVGFNPEEIPVMQYTGLKDKNGKEIYEGDILRNPLQYENSEEYPIAKIEWDNSKRGVWAEAYQ